MQKTTCKYCSKDFTAMGLHLNKCKSNNERVKCIYCDTLYDNIYTHINKCKKNPLNSDLVCRYCDTIYKDKIKHERRCKKNPENIIYEVCRYCTMIVAGNIEQHEYFCSYNPNCAEIETEDMSFIFDFLKTSQINSYSNECPNIKIMYDEITEALNALAISTGYSNSDEMLEEHSLLCPVCYSATKNKLKCDHSLCTVCKTNIMHENDPKCPLCREKIVIENLSI